MNRTDHWRNVHLESDKRAPISLPQPERPFWLSEHAIKALLGKRAA